MNMLAYILTHHSVPNFGANLQAYATASALASRGVTAKFVDFLPEELEKKYYRTVPKEQILSHLKFAKENLSLTSRVRNQDEFLDLCGEAIGDIYIVGSDAVFRLLRDSSRSDLTFPNPYWLVGIPNEKVFRASIAPSAMGCEFSRMGSTVKRDMREALEKFDLLSVRDSWTKKQILSLGVRRPIAEIPDPVFSLIPRIRALAEQPRQSKPYIVLCTQRRRSTSWIKAFTRIAESHGYETVALPTPEGVIDEGTTRRFYLPLEPFEWMKLHAQSSGYVGGRFHPVVVSLCAGLPVVAFDQYHRHPLQRNRSKTWLIMSKFGVSSSCHSRLMHRFLSPGFVWNQIDSQRSGVDAKRRKGDQLRELVSEWYDSIVSRKRQEK